MIENVLFIGVGKMGSAMASRLLDAGISVAVADVAPQALEPFRARGVPAAATGASLPGEIVITMLPTDAHVREALLGADGAVHGQKRRIVIDMSTAPPSSSRALGAELAQHGVQMLDAPVSGGVAGAKTGDMTAMVGGDAGLYGQVEGLLRHMCARVRHVGPLGAGHTLKALNNYLSAVTLWSASEALLIGARAGLDPSTMVEIWQSGSGRSHATEVKLPRAILPRSFDYGMTMRLFAKDVSIAARLARELDVPAPALAAAEENWRLAKLALGPEEDISALLRLLERWAGFEVPAASAS